MIPGGPRCGNRQNESVQEDLLPQIVKNMCVFIILNAITDGFQANTWSRFLRCDWTWRINKDAVSWPAEAPAAGGGIKIVPTSDYVSSRPAVGAVIENSSGTLGPVQEAGLDALVDRWIVDHPLRGVAVPGVATGIAPQVAP